MLVEELNYPAHLIPCPLTQGQVQNTFKHLHFSAKFSKLSRLGEVETLHMVTPLGAKWILTSIIVNSKLY